MLIEEKVDVRVNQSSHCVASFKIHFRILGFIQYSDISTTYQIWLTLTSAPPSIQKMNFTVNLWVTYDLRQGLSFCKFSSVFLAESGNV
jgi:hypothetical protein